MHFAWANWLAARLGSRDVVFGTTVSGRPAGIPGVEHIMGMFINNLPVRAQLDPDSVPALQLAAIQTQLGQLQQHAHLSPAAIAARSEEHTSELQSLMRISYAVFCLKKKKII